MATFQGIETIGKEKHVAILRLGYRETFRIDKESLRLRIKTLTRAKLDTSEDKEALRALEEMSK
jgi:hypothetical protein